MPDTIDGRFDMVAAVTALVLLRLEAEGEAGAGRSVLLTEMFIDDMDATLRQIGIGDYVVGKHVGRMMSALGGRLGAFREALAAGGGFERRGAPQHLPRFAAVATRRSALVAARLERFSRALHALPDRRKFARGRDPRFMTPPEFSRSCPADTLGEGPRRLTIEADETERKALARRFGLVAHRPADRRGRADAAAASDIVAGGTLSAQVVQSCVATAEPVEATVDGPVPDRLPARTPKPRPTRGRARRKRA